MVSPGSLSGKPVFFMLPRQRQDPPGTPPTGTGLAYIYRDMSNASSPPSGPDQATAGGAAAAELAAVHKLVLPLAAAHGVELVDVEWAADQQGRILRVTIERPATQSADGDAAANVGAAGLPADVAAMMARSGVTLKDCVRVSRDVSAVLDAEEPVVGAFRLEVSSPGVERSLKTPQHFRRHIGLVAKVRLATPAVDGQKALRGTIQGFDEQLSLLVDGKLHQVALENIVRARLVYNPKKGEKRQSKRGRKGKRRDRVGAKAEQRMKGQPQGGPSNDTGVSPGPETSTSGPRSTSKVHHGSEIQEG